jgi:hypothetical protein
LPVRIELWPGRPAQTHKLITTRRLTLRQM